MKNYAGRTAGRAVGHITAGRGGAGCGPSYCGAGRAAGYDVAKFVRCGLTAGQVAAGRGGLRAMI